MTEPDNFTLVLVGSLADNNPWDLELWARDDACAKGSTAHWYRAGLGADNPHVQLVSWDCNPHVQRVSWDWLEEHARGLQAKLTVLGTGAP